jgi:hypothetical protein
MQICYTPPIPRTATLEAVAALRAALAVPHARRGQPQAGARAAVVFLEHEPGVAESGCLAGLHEHGAAWKRLAA